MRKATEIQRSRRGAAVRVLARLPCKLMLATVVLCLGVREWYPLSLFPMYANFGPQAWYVCVTDAAARPLPTARYLGIDATMLRRAFETRLRARTGAGMAEKPAESDAARDLLEFVSREARPAADVPKLPEHIALRRTLLQIRGERVEAAHEVIGAIQPPAAGLDIE